MTSGQGQDGDNVAIKSQVRTRMLRKSTEKTPMPKTFLFSAEQSMSMFGRRQQSLWKFPEVIRVGGGFGRI